MLRGLLMQAVYEWMAHCCDLGLTDTGFAMACGKWYFDQHVPGETTIQLPDGGWITFPNYLLLPVQRAPVRYLG